MLWLCVYVQCFIEIVSVKIFLIICKYFFNNYFVFLWLFYGVLVFCGAFAYLITLFLY